MKKLTLFASVLFLLSCGSTDESNSGISSDAAENKKTKVEQKEPTNFGKVTELEPEKNIMLQKVIVADPYEFKERFDIGSVMIDVRSADEFNKSHIPGAKNIPLTDPEFGTKAKAHISELPILVYSQSGEKNQEATQKLSDAGFQKIFNLEGGYDAWIKLGL